MAAIRNSWRALGVETVEGVGDAVLGDNGVKLLAGVFHDLRHELRVQGGQDARGHGARRRQLWYGLLQRLEPAPVAPGVDREPVGASPARRSTDLVAAVSFESVLSSAS